ncbi:cobalamin B12-binding domain protein [Desulfitobacterium hafniense DCB-2]|uniref:Cobalamin B12-binding domain protein n=1 Tax=Desulfitobacterium hafniense (strain DSM 10664 / DCB-2) TaxID=272564 RepID=B8FQI0_DESHD|nr:corrinoid protein [Desulfitobacterium hafniense]ACL19870.1 cobalamin B12-binding domain protein [Desulfitobacterium hafniense DCB-2]
MTKIKEIAKAVAGGKIKVVPGLVQQALDEGIAANEIIGGMTDAMNEVGQKFSAGEIYVPEMLVAAKAMKAGVEILKGKMTEGEGAKAGKCIIGTVAGDLHDIGKNLVAMMIESAGYEVIDLGVDVPADKFIETINANPDCHVVACSALLTTTLESLKNTVAAITAAGLRNQVKILVGGAPVRQSYADHIGADGYASDAPGAARKVKEMYTCFS